MKLEFETKPSSFTSVDHNAVNAGYSENDPAKASNMLRAGIKAAQEGNRAEARNLLLQVTETDPHNENAWLWLASISEYPEELLVFLNNVLEVNPENERALEWAKATKSLLSKTFVQRGIDASKENRTIFARQCFTQAAEHDSQNEMAWLWMASIADSDEEKIEYLKKVLEINPEHETALASLELLTGKPETAESGTPEAAEAEAAAQADETPDLFVENSSLQEEPDSPKYEDDWILESHLTTNFEKKIACFEKVLEINSENELARANLAWLQNYLAKTANESETAEIETAGAAQTNEPEEVEQFEAAEFQQDERAEENQFSAASVEEDFVEESEPELEVASEYVAPAEAEAEEILLETMEDSSTGFVEEFEVREESVGESDSAETPETMAGEEADEQTKFEAEVQAEEEEMSQAFFEEIRSPEPQETLFSADFEPEETTFVEETAEDSREEFPVQTEEESPEPSEIVEFETAQETIETASAEVEEYQPEESEAEELNAAEETSAAQNYSEQVEKHWELARPAETENHIEEEDAEEENYSAVQSEESFLNQPTDEFPAGDYSFPEEIQEEAAAVYEVAAEELFASSGAAENEYIEQLAEAQKTDVRTEESQFGISAEVEQKPAEEATERPTQPLPHETFHQSVPHFFACPFCTIENVFNAFLCSSCNAMLTLSDLEMVLSQTEADHQILEQAVAAMEAEKNLREFDAQELKFLGIGHLNLKNFRIGFAYLQEAVQINPNDVLLASQVNALAIRLAEIERQESLQDSKPKGKKILVVDDSPTVRKLISSKLEKCGHEVVCAVDGVDALDKMKEMSPDLILLDITMPRMDGYQVCKLIRNSVATKDIPVIMISGKDGFFDKVRGRMAGTSGYITKPFGPETLMKTVETYLSESVDADETVLQS